MCVITATYLKYREAPMKAEYEALKKKLSKQMQRNRDKLIREKVHLFYLGLRLGNVSEACERRGVSRDYYYRWWGRFKRSGYRLESLGELSRRPKRSPRKTSKDIERRVLRLGLMGHGAQQIEMVLRRQGISLHASTAGLILRQRKRKNPLLPKWKKKKSHNKRYEVPIPGWRLQVDVKYGPSIFGSPRNFVYVAIDECTRWRFAKSYSSLNQFMTEDFLDALLKETPFPIRCIQTDNGQEFSFKLFGNGSEDHRMTHWCRRHGIFHRLIPPGEKELNGKVERSHRIDAEFFYWKARRKSMKDFNQQLHNWIDFYNHKRPHGGLQGMTPMEKLEERNSVLPWAILEDRWKPWLERYRRWIKEKSEPLEIKLLHQLEKELLCYNHYTTEGPYHSPLSGMSP